MTATTTPDRRTIALADLLTVKDYQIRRRTDPGTVTRYAGLLRAGKELPPVKVGMIDGAAVLLDGFHRVEAHRRAGIFDVVADVVSTTAREAKWLAAEANMAHGLPLKRSEMRSAFRAFIEAGRHLDDRRRLLSLREMAQRCGVGSHNTVLAWLRKDFPRIARQLQAENPRGGGAHPLSGRSLAEIAEDNIAQAVAAARGVTCERERECLIMALKGAAQEIERGAPLRLSDVAPTGATEPEPAF